MATDFAIFLRRFLTGHLAGLRGYSPNTIASYRDAFKLLICYFRDEQHIPPEKLTVEQIDAAAITGFLHWLRTSRHNSASTSNQRLARSTRSSPGCNPRTRPAWPAAKTSSPFPRRNTTGRPSPHLTVAQTRQLLALPAGQHPRRQARRDPAGHFVRHRRQGPNSPT